MWVPKLTWQGHKKDERALRIWTLRLLTTLIVIQKRPLTAILQFYGATINGNWLMTEPCEPIVHRTVFCQKQARSWEGGGGSKQEDWFETSPSWLWTIGTPSVVKFPNMVTKMTHFSHHISWQKWVIDWFDWFEVIKLSFKIRNFRSTKKRANYSTFWKSFIINQRFIRAFHDYHKIGPCSNFLF